MDSSEFIKKNRIKTIYKYSENKFNNGSIQYGWKILDTIPDTKEIILSYPSSSKKTSEQDLDWSRNEGRSATALSDYRKFFNSFVGMSPEEFVKKYDSYDTDSLHTAWNTINKNCVRKDEGLFYLKLAKLIASKEKFSMYGRIFKFYSIGT